MRCGNSKRGKKGISCSKMKETEVSNLPGKMDTSVCLCGMLSFVAPSPDAHFFPPASHIHVSPARDARLSSRCVWLVVSLVSHSRWAHGRVDKRALYSRFACSRRPASLRLGAQTSGPVALVCVPRSGPSRLLATAQTLFTCCNRKIPCRSCGPGGPPGPACA